MTGEAAREAVLVAALRKIARGEGRFSRDHLTHCENTIEDMKAVADAALANIPTAAKALLAELDRLRIENEDLQRHGLASQLAWESAKGRIDELERQRDDLTGANH